MQGFQARFEAYGGDYGETMDRFMGNEALYLRLLNMLFEDDSLQKLAAALDAGDQAAAFSAAHTLKGVAGNLGLTPLYRAVCAMVEPLRREEACDYQALLQAIRAEFEQAEALRRNLGEGG